MVFIGLYNMRVLSIDVVVLVRRSRLLCEYQLLISDLSCSVVWEYWIECS